MSTVKMFQEVYLPRNIFLSIFMLIFNAFTWFYMILTLLGQLMDDFAISSIIMVFFHVSVVVSSLFGVLSARLISRIKLLRFWYGLGVFVSLLPVFIPNFTFSSVSVVSFLLGFSFGLGMPSCLAYYADHTEINNRGKIGGIILCITNLGAFPFASALLFAKSYNVRFIMLALWRLVGLVSFIFLKFIDKPNPKPKLTTSIHDLITNRQFLLYFMPWTLFIFIDRLCGYLLERVLFEAIFGSFSSIVAGFLADTFGRKRIVIYGFILLGIAYGVIGIAPNMLISYYIHVVLDGIAAGILWVVFITVIWGDLTKPGVREEAYMLGNIFFFISQIVPTLLFSYLIALPLNSVFSLASFFLFLAVLPLMYAPETLPEREIKRRELRKYIEKAKKIREKYEKQKEG